MRVLTLYLCKDREHFDPRNFDSVRAQKGVDQEIVLVSAEPIRVEGALNVVVPVKREWPLPVRVGYSINAAIRRLQLGFGLRLSDYDYILKVDSDVWLPPDYIENLTSKRAPVAGVGAALLISVPFFIVALKGVYPVKHCDDGYISALSISLGAWPPHYSGRGRLRVPPVRFEKKRELAYGIEYYRWGLSPILMLLLPFASRLIRLAWHERRSFRAHITNAAGYLAAALRGTDKYAFHALYRKMRNRHFSERVLEILVGAIRGRGASLVLVSKGVHGEVVREQ